MKQHSLKLLQQRISGSESAQMAEAVAATQAELQQAKAAAEAAKQKKADMIKAAKVTCPGQTCLNLKMIATLHTWLAVDLNKHPFTDLIITTYLG